MQNRQKKKNKNTFIQSSPSCADIQAVRSLGCIQPSTLTKEWAEKSGPNERLSRTIL